MLFKDQNDQENQAMRLAGSIAQESLRNTMADLSIGRVWVVPTEKWIGAEYLE